VLGFYLGTLLYLFLVMIDLTPDSDIVSIQLNVLVAIVAGVSCLILFTYFIHTISQGIQVELILEGIFQKTKHQLSLMENEEFEQDVPNDAPEGYAEIKSDREGYYNGFNKEGLVSFCHQHDYKFIIPIRQGTYIYPGMTVGFISASISKEEKDKSFKYFFLENSVSDDHYMHGLKHISEIGVKALSPGINDPGTAIKAINYLTVLIIKRMTKSEKNILLDSDKNVRVMFKALNLSTLIYYFYTPFRTYGGNDITVMLTMLRAFNALIRIDISRQNHVSTFYDAVMSIRNTIETDIRSQMDKVMCNVEIENINALNYFSKSMPLLAV
jgi:uncharacterized membrane protein